MTEKSIEAEQVYIGQKHGYVQYLTAKGNPNHFLSNPEFGHSKFGSLQGTEEDRIAYFMCHVPDVKLVAFQGCTYNILQTWLAYKNECIEIAQCFLSTQGGSDDILLQSRNKGEIDEWQYQYKWLETTLYKNLWHLLHENHVLFIRVLKENWNYTFASDVDLLCEIFREVIEAEFLPYIASFHQYAYQTLLSRSIGTLVFG
ncbi:MAG: hypothetical protein KAF91_18110 [Nostoc sp. TH1S01]|nr:hypothetical protein [Nostoc sp. TH1S01]